MNDERFCCRCCCETVVPGLQAELATLRARISGGGANRYWEARWRDEAKENDQLRAHNARMAASFVANQDVIKAAVAVERERCARVVEDECIYLVGRLQSKAIAERIRKGP